MAFKINIKPDLESEMERLLKKTKRFRSKTEYINEAILAFNHQLRRQTELERLGTYFRSESYRSESGKILDDFSGTRKIRD